MSTHTNTTPIAEVVSHGGRSGYVETADNGFRVELQEPSSENPGGVTPEHLFGAAWAACYHGAIRYVARQRKQPLEGSAVTALVKHQSDNERPFAVELRVTLPGIDTDEAERITQAAHELCSYTRATQGRVDVRTTFN